MLLERRAMMFKKPRIPVAYQEVTYIGNSSRSYIDTGYKPNVNTEVELKFAVNSFGTQAGNQLMGSANTSNGTPGYLLGATVSSSSSFILWGRLGTGTLNYGFKSVTDTQPHTWIMSKTGMTFDGQFYTISTPADLATRLTYSFYLFARHQNNSLYPTTGNFNLFDVYECIIRESGVVQRHFIPCYRKSDNIRGLYDIKNNVFYTNKGTGTFRKGGNV